MAVLYACGPVAVGALPGGFWRAAASSSYVLAADRRRGYVIAELLQPITSCKCTVSHLSYPCPHTEQNSVCIVIKQALLYTTASASPQKGQVARTGCSEGVDQARHGEHSSSRAGIGRVQGCAHSTYSSGFRGPPVESLTFHVKTPLSTACPVCRCILHKILCSPVSPSSTLHLARGPRPNRPQA